MGAYNCPSSTHWNCASHETDGVERRIRAWSVLEVIAQASLGLYLLHKRLAGPLGCRTKMFIPRACGYKAWYISIASLSLSLPPMSAHLEKYLFGTFQCPNVLTSLVGVLAIISISYYARCTLKALPPGPRGLPLLGNVLQLPTQEPWRVYKEWEEKYGKSKSYIRCELVLMGNETRRRRDLS